MDNYRAGAGKASTGDLASAVFNNPAAMTALDKKSLLVNGIVCHSSLTHSDSGSTDASGASVNGSNRVNDGSDLFAP